MQATFSFATMAPAMPEIALLRREFGFHRLALEEVTKPHERPRCEAYGGYYFLVTYAAAHAGKEFAPQELSLGQDDRQ